MIKVATIIGIINRLSAGPSLSEPFSVSQNEAELTSNLRVNTGNVFSFYLDLYFKEGDQSDRDRVRALAGSPTRDREGKHIDNGLPIPTNLIIMRVEGADRNIVIDENFSNHELEGWSNNFYSKRITTIRLSPGNYEIKIKSLRDNPELVNVPVNFDVHIRSYK